MLFVLVGILILYVGPVRAYFQTKHRAAAQSAVVERLRARTTACSSAGARCRTR